MSWATRSAQREELVVVTCQQPEISGGHEHRANIRSEAKARGTSGRDRRPVGGGTWRHCFPLCRRSVCDLASSGAQRPEGCPAPCCACGGTGWQSPIRRFRLCHPKRDCRAVGGDEAGRDPLDSRTAPGRLPLSPPGDPSGVSLWCWSDVVDWAVASNHPVDEDVSLLSADEIAVVNGELAAGRLPIFV